LVVPVTVAEKRCCPPLGIPALPGKTPTITCGRIVTLADALRVLETWLVAVISTGLEDGTPAGAR
jgi:hypothetical protein